MPRNQPPSYEPAGARYRDNSARHIIALARHSQSEIMRILRSEYGHTLLRLQFEPYIAHLSQRDMRLSDIALAIGISRQGANQVVDQIETAGYLQRRVSEEDARVKILSLTASGRQLVEDAIAVITRVSDTYQQRLGNGPFEQLGDDASTIAQRLELLPDINRAQSQLALYGALPRLADFITAELMRRTMARGHPGLKLSFGQVMTQIGPNGGRIHLMARTHDVSKQAISAIAAELVALGYLESSADPLDRRQRVLKMTRDGRQLIADSVISLDELELAIAHQVGARTWKRFIQTLADLYRQLELEADTFDLSANEDLHALALRLRAELGAQQSRNLGQLLLSPAT